MKRWIAAIGLVSLMASMSAGQGDGAKARVPLKNVTLEQVMADPDWIARSPERPYWADDGTGIYYSRKREGSEIRDLWRVDVRLVSAGTDARYEVGEPRMLSDAERLKADVRFGDRSEDRQWKVFSRDGDLCVKNLESGTTRALTKTAANEFGGRFMVGDRKVMFQRDGAVLVRDLESGLEEQLVDLRFEKEPEERKEKTDFLAEEQERLFDYVKESKERREEGKKREKEEKDARKAAGVPVVYMGDEGELRQASASPSGDWMLVRVGKKGKDGRRDTVPAFVTEDGYVRAAPARTKVGTGERHGEELYLIDLRPGKEERRWKLDLASLPGIADDPLAEIRKAAEARRKENPGGKDEKKDGEKKDGQKKEEKKKDEPKPRDAVIRDIEWSDDGARAVVQVFSLDNKGRWIAAVDFDQKKIVPLERMHDDAWINGRFAELGWLKDNRTIWYLSEETGYSQVFALDLDKQASGDTGKRRVTGWDADGKYEASDVHLSLDGRRLYFTANIERPGVHELYSVDLASEGAAPQRLTFMGGENDAVLAPDERGLAILHSDTTTPPELYVQPLMSNHAAATRVTRTVTDAYGAIDWIAPEIVAVPGRDGKTIWARFIEKKESTGAGRHQGSDSKRPVVVFVHGAGYLQDVHEGWSEHYFREHMFHNLLAERGYLVIAPDFRASAGYGRDWRTAIYRRMGDPELDDVHDCIVWLVKERNADGARVGIYGGSYGGFLTLMAMFTRPGEYACGAALRPVTDWAHYNDGYTANILNTPDTDPVAYEQSSPIEHAAGLRGRLLICHGMMDDNVFFQDTVRLSQRLIELKKENWEVAMYPVESHGFREATSWLDEYRRIDRLFRETLESMPAGTAGSASR